MHSESKVKMPSCCFYCKSHRLPLALSCFVLRHHQQDCVILGADFAWFLWIWTSGKLSSSSQAMESGEYSSLIIWKTQALLQAPSGAHRVHVKTALICTENKDYCFQTMKQILTTDSQGGPNRTKMNRKPSHRTDF